MVYTIDCVCSKMFRVLWMYNFDACMQRDHYLITFKTTYIHKYTYIIIQKAARRVKPCLSSQSDLLGGLLGSLF